MIINPILEILINKLNAGIKNRLFLVFQLFQSVFSSKRRKKILFTDHIGLKAELEKAFKFTKHEIAFGEISHTNIKNYDLVVPLMISDVRYLNKVRNFIIDNPIPIPSIESINLTDDKYILNQLLIENGFRSLIPKIGGTQSFPYILKKSIGHSSENCHIIFDSQQELSLSDALNNPEYFTQELIPGSYEYATHILFKDQKIISSLNIEYSFDTETPIKGKNKPLYTKVCHCPYLNVFSAILVLIGFEGLCCFNYKEFESLLYIIEINPRFGGSLAPYFSSFINHLE